MASKDFAAIETDYAFFMSHSTEAENDLAAYSRELQRFAEGRDTICMLDYGCGGGKFTERFVSALNWNPSVLELTLVEPVQHQREQAVHRLAKFSSHSITQADTLPDLTKSPFDLILSNHVLYYVDDLDAMLQQLNDSLAPSGSMLLAIAGWDNVLLQLWKFGFATLNQPVPYHTAEDVQSILSRLRVSYRKEKCHYQLRFRDSEAHRMKILRFLFGEYLSQISADVLLPEFDRYVAGDHIDVRTYSLHFVVNRI